MGHHGGGKRAGGNGDDANADGKNGPLTASSAGAGGEGYLAVSAEGDAVTARLNRLEYLADMISELQVMAGDCGGTTLQGLLALAYAEARQNIKRLKPTGGGGGGQHSMTVGPSNLGRRA